MSFSSVATPAGRPENALAIADAAARESRCWAWLFTAGALSVGIWMVLGNPTDWTIFAGFAVCAGLAGWESQTRQRDVARLRTLTGLVTANEAAAPTPTT